jgi:hypothetical protein
LKKFNHCAISLRHMGTDMLCNSKLRIKRFSHAGRLDGVHESRSSACMFCVRTGGGSIHITLVARFCMQGHGEFRPADEGRQKQE